jgi:nucleotide-binding universal stress UspA family protein
MRYLIGVDGSHGSLDGARLAAQLAGASDQIVLYYSPPEMQVRSGWQPEPEIVERSRQALASVVFDAARQAMPEAARERVTTLVGTQNPRTGLLIAAEDQRADLLVVGARGVGALERWFLGSVSHTVARSARIPVLIARPPHSAGGTLRVLVACEGTEADSQLYELLRGISWPAATLGRVIAVVESLYAGQVPQWLEHKARSPETEAIAAAFVREHEAEKQATLERMKNCCQQLPPAFRHDPIIAEGHPAEQILAAIAREQIDLVIVGARGMGVVSRLLLGSTSEKVLSGAPCSVLVVHRRERP